MKWEERAESLGKEVFEGSADPASPPTAWLVLTHQVVRRVPGPPRDTDVWYRVYELRGQQGPNKLGAPPHRVQEPIIHMQDNKPQSIIREEWREISKVHFVRDFVGSP